MMKKRYFFLFITLTLAVFGGGATAFSQTDDAYTLHPPALSVPDGPPGEIKRSIMQFEAWTLICDENRTAKQVVCNITQAVEDANRNVVFSWSLAASRDGKPFMLLRALPEADKALPIEVKFDESEQVIKISYIGCDENVCLAQTPVGPILSKHIGDGSITHISYRLKDGKTIAFDATLKGLRAAVSSINQ